MNPLNDPARLSRIIARGGYRKDIGPGVNNYIKQSKLEKAARKFVTEAELYSLNKNKQNKFTSCVQDQLRAIETGNHAWIEELMQEVVDLVRDYTDEELVLAYDIYVKKGIVEAIANHPKRKKRDVSQKLYQYENITRNTEE